MSLVNLSHVCSHIQNASKARLGLTSIPYTKLHATLSNELLKSGFISQVSIGGAQPPAGEPSPILGQVNVAVAAEEQGVEGSGVITPANRPSRRLWLGLKYWDNKPVISHMNMISKPTRRIWCGAQDLVKLSRGQKAGYVDGMRQIGEAIYVSTDRGILELRECVERGIGGQLLCRVW